MKLKLFPLSLILIFLTNSSFLYATSPVLDVDGDEVKPGVEYYVTRPIGFFGGLAPSTQRCPSTVHETVETDRGQPITLHPFNDDEGKVIYENSTELIVTFSAGGTPTMCGFLGVIDDKESGRTFIMANYVGTMPRGRFKIVQTRSGGIFNVYKFATLVQNRWLDTAIVDQRRLAVADQPNDVPYQFVFFKVNSGVIQLPK